MKNNILAICILCALVFTSCKKEEKKEEAEAKKVENVITLSNFSDVNWKSGVAVEFNMFLADNTPANLELIKKAKKLVFADGTFATVTGYTEADKFIRINLAEKASTFMAQAAYPFEIKVE